MEKICLQSIVSKTYTEIRPNINISQNTLYLCILFLPLTVLCLVHGDNEICDVFYKFRTNNPLTKIEVRTNEHSIT